MRWLFLFVLVLGCEATPPEGRFDCMSDDDCPEEMVCRPLEMRCYYTLGDGG